MSIENPFKDYSSKLSNILKSPFSLLFPGLKRFEREFAEVCDQLDQMNTSVKRIEEKTNLIEEKIDSEPIPPNPETATPEEIEAYKEAVSEAGNMPPQRK